MRLYKITATRTPKGEATITKTRWVGSKADGVAVRKTMADEDFVRKEITEAEVDVPTDKAGLLAYLNMLAGA